MTQQYVLQSAHKDNTIVLLIKVAIIALLIVQLASVQQIAHVYLIFVFKTY